MEITVRPALEKEIETLLEFEKGVIAAERPFDSTLKKGEIHYYDLIELIRSPDAEVVVAIAGIKLVGSGYAKIKEAQPYLDHTHFAYLGFMYVLPEFRGSGINQLILSVLINWAKTKNITEIKLDVYNENEVAKKAYLKAGFTPYLLQMRIRV